ncbi:hypothetical protein QE152_g25510 [Popillia japonica]|uniref:Uncharacterized protein n=1 Tax=Popillia japonica TaxID=7064 RepID=A0AAW1K0K2_POPJA
MVAKETIDDETEDIQATNEDDNLQILQIFCLRFQDFQIVTEETSKPGWKATMILDTKLWMIVTLDIMQYDNEDEELEGMASGWTAMRNKKKDVQGN